LTDDDSQDSSQKTLQDSGNRRASLSPPIMIAKSREPQNIRIFVIREAAMAPDFVSGEQVLIDLQDTTPAPQGLFLISDGFSELVRICALVPRSNPAEVRISATAQNFLSQVLLLSDVTIIGRVIARLREV
jgi:hypothetical protein